MEREYTANIGDSGIRGRHFKPCKITSGEIVAGIRKAEAEFSATETELKRLEASNGVIKADRPTQQQSKPARNATQLSQRNAEEIAG
jgi:hypothetical protein